MTVGSEPTATGPDAGQRARDVRRRWIPGALVGLAFLAFPAVDVAVAGGAVLPRLLGLAVLAFTGLMYLLVTPAAMGWTPGRQLLLLALILLVSAGLWPTAGSGLVVVWMFIGIMAGATMSFRHTAVVALSLAAGMLALSQVDHQPAPWELAGAMVGLSFWMCAFMGNIKLTRELQETREELAVAAVAAERERIGRDLHDILGHSLTAIAVKAGLARRLIEQGAPGAAEEIGGVEALARDALADVRATASGFRDVSLGAELALAGTILRSAGITAELPTAVDEVDPGVRELFGYVVREAVTNVVRHSGASGCTVTVGRDWVQVVDDGHGIRDEVRGSGSGLTGLRKRVEQVGGTLQVIDRSARAGRGFAVRATVPGRPVRDAFSAADQSR